MDLIFIVPSGARKRFQPEHTDQEQKVDDQQKQTGQGNSPEQHGAGSIPRFLGKCLGAHQHAKGNHEDGKSVNQK